MQAQILTVTTKDTTPSSAEHSLAFRNAMSHLAAAVNIVTTDGEGGMAGFAATAVCSVSDNPPTMLVCINRASSAYSSVIKNRVVCINTLTSEHQTLSALFGGKTPMAERFAAGVWSRLETGSPALDGAMVSLDCVVRDIHDGGTHDILICDVQCIRHNGQGEALLYFNRSYRTL
jgi:flavin reductase